MEYIYSKQVKNFYCEMLSFILKQAYACIFGGFLLFMIIITGYYYPLEGILYRYDFLFISAIVFQVFLILLRFESCKEVIVIAIFHIVALIMEIFKTHPSIGSWSYPESAILSVLGVPLFAGFMYSAVGSYIARSWRVFDFRFTQYPAYRYTLPIALAIYVNFFTHHFIWDFRYIIIFFVIITFGRGTIYFKVQDRYQHMNLLFAMLLVALFIWIGENIGTYTHTWIYPTQLHDWHMVGLEKITAWFLLVIVSGTLVSLVHKPIVCNESLLTDKGRTLS